jgi:hypothetical protein
VPWGKTGPAALSLGGHKYRGLILQVGGLNARLMTFSVKQIIVAKFKEVKTGLSTSGKSSKIF